MEQKINIAEKLKDCPKGTMFYSPVFGDVKLVEVKEENGEELIVILCEKNGETYKYSLTAYGEGRLYGGVTAESILYPSKDCRTWENFKAPWEHKHFEPFQKVLVKSRVMNGEHIWIAAIYSHYDVIKHSHVLTNFNAKRDDDILPYEGNESLLGAEVEP